MEIKFTKKDNKIKMLNIAIMLMAIFLLACEKDSDNLILDKGPDDVSSLPDSTYFNDTVMIRTGVDEVLFSFTLAAGSKDAVIYYNVEGMDFSGSIYLTEGININIGPMDQGPSCQGVKLSLPTVCVLDQTLRQYNFTIDRPGSEEKQVHFGFYVLSDGRYSIYDSNSAGADQDFCYYIKADDEGNPAYINVKFN